MTMTGFIDYTKPLFDRQRTTSNVEPLPTYNAGGAASVSGAVWGVDAQGVTPTKPSVQIGVEYNLTLPTVSSGQKVNLQAGPRGQIYSGLVDPTSGAQIGAGVPADAMPSFNSLFVLNRHSLFNGSSWDRARTIQGADNTTGTGVAAVSEPTLSTSDLLGNAINFNAAGDNTIVAGVAGQTIRTHRIVFVAAGATNITIKDGAGTPLTGPMAMVAGVPYVLTFSGRPYFKTSAGNNFVINNSAAVQVSGRVEYKQSA